VNRTVAESLRGESGLRIESLGLNELKGRDEPVEVYALHAADSTGEQREGVGETAA
jgi:hypothetical protein